MNLLDLHKELKRPLLLDGAVGSYLQQLNYAQNDSLWSTRALLEYPEKVALLHREYVNAGCDILTSNTFRTNPLMLNRSGFDKVQSKMLVNMAVELAKKEIGNKKIMLAGSNPPAEDCYQPERTVSQSELEMNHRTHIENLHAAGVDIIWNETQSHWDEIKLICKICSDANLEYTVNIFFTAEGKILSGESVTDTIKLVSDYSPSAIGFNCISFIVMNKILMPELKSIKWGFYLNCFIGEVTNPEMSTGVGPEEYTKEIKPILKFNPIYIGSCCGSSPAHTKALRKAIDEIY